jgi:hypothetical protein
MSWFKKIANMSLPMTPAEQNWASWAIEPMWDHWTTEDGAWDRDGNQYEEVNLPRIEGTVLFLSNIPEINDDLLYRLEEQSFDTSECDANSEQQKAARCRAAFSLAQKIRNIL